MALSTMEKIEAAKGTRNRRYNMSTSQCFEIYQNSSGVIEMIANGFMFGYMQGMKAAKAEAKKAGKAGASR